MAAGSPRAMDARGGLQRICGVPPKSWPRSAVAIRPTHMRAAACVYHTSPSRVTCLSLFIFIHRTSSHRRHIRVEATSLACEYTHLTLPDPRYASNVSQKERHGQSAHLSPFPTRHRYRCHSKSALSTRHPNSSPSAEARVCEDCSTAG